MRWTANWVPRTPRSYQIDVVDLLIGLGYGAAIALVVWAIVMLALYFFNKDR